MRIGYFGREFEGEWRDERHEAFAMPELRQVDGTTDAIAARVEAGEAALEACKDHTVDMLFDRNGSGLLFVRGDGGMAELKLLHEVLEVPLVSCCESSIVQMMAGLQWDTAWQVLQSHRWIKLCHDARHAAELTAFGVPSVAHMPAGLGGSNLSGTGIPNVELPEFGARKTVADPDRFDIPVLFIGDAGPPAVASVPPATHLEAWIGMVAAVSGGYADAPPFFDLYHSLYNCNTSPEHAPDEKNLAELATIYVRSRQRFLGELALRARDRFVLFLKGKIGPQFSIMGKDWTEAYGLDAAAEAMNPEERARQVRRAAINIALPDANCESAISVRHFEISRAGGFMLACATSDIAQYLEPGKECAVFHDEKSLLENIDYYLSHPQERAEIAAAGQQRIARDHLLGNRLATMIQYGSQLVTRKDAAPSPATGPNQQELGRITSAINKALKKLPQRQQLEAVPVKPSTAPTVQTTASQATENKERSADPSTENTAGRSEAGTAAIENVPTPGRLLVLNDPGNVSRNYMMQMATAAEKLGISTIVMEIEDVWKQARNGKPVDPEGFSAQLREWNVKAVIGARANGALEWQSHDTQNGGPRTVFQKTGIPHLMWWTDHPQWSSAETGLTPELLATLRGDSIFHFAKSGLAAEEFTDILGWPNCHELIVAEDPDDFTPQTSQETEYDIVTIAGTMHDLHPSFTPLLNEDDPGMTALYQLAGQIAGDELNVVWHKRAPQEMIEACTSFGETWLKERIRHPLVGSYRVFRDNAAKFPEVADWLRENPPVYFEAVKALWQLGNWQRPFFIKYLSRFFNIGVFGRDWSHLGFSGGPWIPHHDLARTYARGRLALNIPQGNDEEGLTHKPFQIAASGVAGLHLRRAGMESCFEANSEILLFDSPGEARELVANYLAHPYQRNQVAEKSRERVVNTHTWPERLTEMFELAGVTFSGRHAGSVARPAAVGTQ